jgi:hypothetical protein
MPATAPDLDDQDFSDPGAAVSRLDAAREEDAYWQQTYWREPYFKVGYDYEDYAPAYCVGYIGQAQYGGAFDDAEPWLCSNWERIKGDSRLALDDACLAMRSAWERMARESAIRGAKQVVSSVRPFRSPVRRRSLELSNS